ncbi:MAG: hypothetical protein R3272_15060 [Candidatus Promineifilaceae bacterium]|nr:hypothetical protein [Candidatus Promineifilaceae bacterium]
MDFNYLLLVSPAWITGAFFLMWAMWKERERMPQLARAAVPVPVPVEERVER